EFTDCWVIEATCSARRRIAVSVNSGTTKRSMAGLPSASTHTSPGLLTQISMTSGFCNQTRMGSAAFRKNTGRVSQSGIFVAPRALIGVLEFIQRLFHRVRIEVGEIEIPLHEHENSRALIDVDRRRNVNLVLQRLFRHARNGLRRRLGADLPRAQESRVLGPSYGNELTRHRIECVLLVSRLILILPERRDKLRDAPRERQQG